MVWLVLTLLVQQRTLERSLLADTSAPVRQARAAQERFELGRLRLLPIGDGGRGRCDERMGRFCYWYDDGDTTLPADPPSVKASRAQLLQVLQSTHRASPENDWITGQLVRYLIDQTLSEAADSVAARCNGTPWWCLALTGLTHHTSGRFQEADSAFDAALTAMPDSTRCEWTDWTLVLEPDLATRARDLPCAERAALADTVFWLGQPLFGASGNDLRTEFYSRRVMVTLSAVAKSPHRIPWGRDMTEMLLRYGWSTRYTATPDRAQSLELPSVSGHSRMPAYGFLPRSGDEGDPDSWRWELDGERPRSRYSPEYLDRYADAEEVVIARFPRGDSTLVVGSLFDRKLIGRSPSLSLAGGSGPRATARATTGSPDNGSTMTLMVPGNPLAIGLEATIDSGRTVFRARRHFAPRSTSAGVVLSDPLFFAPDEELPATLESAVVRTIAVNRVSRSEPLGVYWETSGAGSDSTDVSIAVIPIKRGLLGRIGEGLSVVKRRAPLTLQWQSTVDPGVLGRAIELDLSRLKPGRYLLRLEARQGDRIATSERTFELIP